MAKKAKHRASATKQNHDTGMFQSGKSLGPNLKDMLKEDVWQKLKQLERDVKDEEERKRKEEAERRKREQEERERNKSFAELLEEYDRKGIGKYS